MVVRSLNNTGSINIKTILDIPKLRRSWQRSRRWSQTRRNNLRVEKERIEAELEKLGYPPGLRFVLESLAKALAAELDRDWDILGPFGLRCTMSIHLYKKGVDEDDQLLGDNCLSITFIPGNCEMGQFYVLDYSRNTGRYPKGSIGDFNDMNYVAVEVLEDADFQWFLERVS